MAKIVLSDPSSGYNVAARVTANNDLLESTIERILFRDGTAPNEMEANLDMNSNRILNLLDAVNLSEPVTLRQAADLLDMTTVATQQAIGALLFPQTPVEASLGVTPTDFSYRVGNVLRYGADPTGNTSSVLAFQTAINVVANEGHGAVYVPRGTYDLSSAALYFHHDAINNPDFPSSVNRQGNILLLGEGHMDHNAFDNAIDQGSILDMGARTLTIGDGTAVMRNVRLENLTVKANNANQAVLFTNVSRGTGFDKFGCIQEGVGTGVEMSGCFLVDIGYAFIYTNNGANTGVGFYLHNPTSASGMYNIEMLSAKGGFAQGALIGEEDASAGSLSQVRAFIQSNGNAEGVVIARGCRASEFWLHLEGSTTTGGRIWQSANNITLHLYCSNPAATESQFSLGKSGETNSTNPWADITIEDLHFAAVPAGGVGLEAFFTASCQNLRIDRGVVTPATPSSGTVIDLNGATNLHGVSIGPIRQTAAFGTFINGIANVDLVRNPDTLGRFQYRAPITAAGLAFRQVDVASATNIAWIDTANVWRITGTTTINTIAAPTEGNPVIYLHFTDNVTVNDATTSSGNIHLSGAANFAATDNDTLSLIWDSTDSRWMQLGRAAN